MNDTLPNSPRLGHIVESIFFFGALLLLGISLIYEYQRPRAPRRSACKLNLKSVALALLNYHEDRGTLPPAHLVNQAARPIHSWRVLILPYLDQSPLWQKYSFNEPWDGPGNRRLHDASVPEYCCPSDRTKSAETSFVAVVGPRTAFPGARGVSMKAFTDGQASTIMAVQMADSGIHWIEPRDLDVQQMEFTINPKSGRGISSRHANGAHVVMADGSVRFLSNNTSPEIVQALLTIDGGEVIPPEKH